MEVPSNIGTKVRRNITPVKLEDQIIPAAAVLKRGRLDLGVILCIRGNKVHYYSFILQKKVSVFEEWLFKMPVKFGQQLVNDIDHLKKMMKKQSLPKCSVKDKEKEKAKDVPKLNFNTIRDTFSNIEAVTLSNSINSSLCTITSAIDRLAHEVSSNNKFIRSIQQDCCKVAHNLAESEIKTRTTQEQLNALDAKISALDSHLINLHKYNLNDRSGTHQEIHVTNSLTFQDCNFNKPAEEYEQASTTTTQPEQSNASDRDEDPLINNSETSDSDNEREDFPIFKVQTTLMEHHWKRFQLYYKRFNIFDVYFSEIQWMRNNGMLELVRKLAPYVLGQAPPIKHQPVGKSLRILFDILRTSRVCR